MRYPNAAKGIKKIYLAEILGILALVLAIVLGIMVAGSHVDTSISGEEAAQALQAANVGTPFVILGIAMMLIMLASYVLNLIGVVNASKDDEGFKRALWALLASIAFGVVAAILEIGRASCRERV